MTSPDAMRGHLAMLVFSALVAGSFSLGALAAPLIDPGALTALRFLLAGALVGAVALGRGAIRRAAFDAPWRYALLGGLLAAYFVLMFHGLKTAPPVSAAAVFTLTPIMAAGFGWLLLRQRLSPRMALALTLGAAGALWVIFRADWRAVATLSLGRGEAIYFLGCIAHALYAPLVRKLNRGESALTFTFLTMVAGWALLMVWAKDPIRATDWTDLPAIVWITLIYLAIAASAASFVLLQYASLRLPAAKVMSYTYLTPAWVILWELGLGHTAPTWATLAGMVLIGIALWLLLEDTPERSTLF
ncbi:MAG: DMT family transporter [Pseudotabrizicola sp.]|uniref:DMT family transporter n=1 Tax=Pseudotabrizicola sp. TaxID=2939647 RepID=UPI0027293954|nr:DMT family transporter [Pseudotabrizicola sp.]MDO8884870.1 DMT family transporter [Pseudotabrizicola sp.]MDP2080014.1 DMT family transporter [Pseudotabrizicola sp.]MDZ7575460.1 DMT family transporter [Pseudotabrizicola sp.]